MKATPTYPQNQEQPIQQGSELKRPDFKLSIFLGIQGSEDNDKALKLLAGAFPEHHIHIFDRELFNHVTEKIIKKHIKWKEDQGVLEYTSKPENIQVAVRTALKINETLGDGWFTLKDLVDETNFSYEQAGSVLDLQYAFGFLAKDETGTRIKYKSITSPAQRYEYVKSVRDSLTKEANEVNALLEKMVVTLDKADVVNEYKAYQAEEQEPPQTLDDAK